tara:strand:- start:374 stop:1336 length:963 start_codon:yes stop_codon:yes gene_type:complete
MPPLVTIGMPTYNRAEFLKRSIDCILRQSFNDFELIIYDDGSTDNTLDILSSLKDERLSYVSFKNSGIPEPLNYIYKNARGEFIIILHDHDLVDQNLIEKCVEQLEKHTKIGFVLPGGSNVDSDGESNLVELLDDLPLKNNGNQFLMEMLEDKKSFACRFHGCSMVRKSALKDIGLFYNKKYGWYADIDLWMRLLKEYDFIYLKESLINFTRREENHEINVHQIRTINNLYEIHEDNINNIFLDSHKLSSYKGYLSQRYFSAIFRIFLNEISKGNIEITKQFEEVNKKALKKLHHRLAIYILKLKIFSFLLVSFRRLLRG